MASAPNSFEEVRNAVLSAGQEARVEVNQRALIDKILARYATQGAVYRELLQNSNDADARNAEIRFTTAAPSSSPHNASPAIQRIVTQVVYRNDGHPFREEDWTRLRNIAEGNPDVTKVGAFGVGAYTMFSICEQPLVISNKSALAFAWRGDALWARTGPAPKPDPVWTTFVLPSRDPYPLPNIVSFAQFLCASLTFTASLSTIRLFVDDKLRLTISKKVAEPPRPLIPPRNSSWFANDGMQTTSPNSLFTIPHDDDAIRQSLVAVSVDLDSSHSDVSARFISASAQVRINSEMQRQIVRVTKKNTPRTVKVQVFVDAAARPESAASAPRTDADAVAGAFSPAVGAGHVYIGFRTSQTTGLAAHLAAPLVPTVEREAVDLQNPALRTYNSDLLFVCGMLMRLTLEESMAAVGARFEKSAPERAAEEKKLREEHAQTTAKQTKPEDMQENQEKEQSESAFSFVRFMTSGVRRIADVLTSTVDSLQNSEDFLNPPDPRPLSVEERDAVMLMRAFCPEKSTPDPTIGAIVANGFTRCMPSLSPPVLTQSGFARGSESRLPFRGIEAFVKSRVVRNTVFKNATNYMLHVAGCKRLDLADLRAEMGQRVLKAGEIERLLRWWAQYTRSTTEMSRKESISLKNSVSFEAGPPSSSNAAGKGKVLGLKNIHYYSNEKLSSESLPMPPSVLPKFIENEITVRKIRETGLNEWFQPLPFETWAEFVVRHPCLTQGNPEDDESRIDVMSALSREHGVRNGEDRLAFETWLRQSLAKHKCVVVDSPASEPPRTDFPEGLYLPNAEIGIFQGLGYFEKVSPRLKVAGISDDFLLAIGVRKAISIDFLLTHLDTLKWSENPAPLIKYLRSVTLSENDLDTLRTTQYLPASKDKGRMFAPSELYLPNSELDIFPFLKVLQWPVPEDLHGKSPDLIFLKKLGCLTQPSLEVIVKFIEKDVKDGPIHFKCLQFLSSRLGPRGPYDKNDPILKTSKLLPTISRNPLHPQNVEKQRAAPSECFWDRGCESMGFRVFDPSVNQASGGVLVERFQCSRQPNSKQLILKLKEIVAQAKHMLSKDSGTARYSATVKSVQSAMKGCYRYLETRTSDFQAEHRDALCDESFIPYMTKDKKIEWGTPKSVYFSSENNDITSLLYPAIPFDGFLAAIGVGRQPLLGDVLSLMVRSPDAVLEKLGSVEKYSELLRRVAAAPPFQNPTSIRDSPFLLGHRFEGEETADVGDSQAELKTAYALAKASDIFIIDNAFMSRLFPVLTAPQESDLERLYESLGSQYISKVVRHEFHIIGPKHMDTQTVKFVKDRINERRPLLVSGSMSSRPMSPTAASTLSSGNLNVAEVVKITANYSLRGVTKSNEITCCSSKGHGSSSNLFLVPDFDWFDIGNAIGSLILKRCHLEDAFLLGSILEAPLGQLRARGFPVDRILKAAAPISPEVTTTAQNGTAQANAKQQPQAPSQSKASSSASSRPLPGHSGEDQGEGFVEILKQMFPDCDPTHIRYLLGHNPTPDALKRAADVLADGNYPRDRGAARDSSSENNQAHPPVQSAKKSLGNQRKEPNNTVPTSKSPTGGGTDGGRHIPKPASRLLSRAFRGFGKGLDPSGPLKSPKSRLAKPDGPNSVRSSKASDAPQEISVPEMQDQTKRMLRDATANGARPVSDSGVQSAKQYVPTIPENIHNGVSCEVIDGMDLKLVSAANESSTTSNGTKVFASRKTVNAEQYVLQHWNAVEKFAGVLRYLSEIYELRPDSVAVYFDRDGKTIAFNSNGALYFNLRFFHELHYRGNATLGEECYSYWYTVMAHELAHNFVSLHNREHGRWMESYIATYLPRLTAARSVATRK